ncbi:LacI family DNA-binding transcriptional regulator [Leifsonia lichenia]
MAENKRPTIVDVAREAGVSVSTASNALTGVRRVKPETRRRIRKIADQLGYEPNLVARSLVSKRSGMVGILMPDITDNFLTTFIRGVERVVAPQGLGLMIGDSGNDSGREERYLKAFQERRVEGLLIVPTAGTDLAQVNAIADEIPTVVVDREIYGWTGDFVSCDHRRGAEMMVDHLVSLGHTRIAQLAGDQELSSARTRHAATRARLADHGLFSVTEGFSSFTTEDARDQAARILGQIGDFTALIGGDDLLALAALGAAHRAGVSVPDDLSVAGFDDIPFAELAWPPLTTIRQPVGRIATEATRLLLEREAGPGRHVLLQPELVVRDSTGTPGGAPASA